jgi:hypothetical protein
MKFRDAFNFDVHAIDELKTRGVPPTDESPKYRYTCDAGIGLAAEYSRLLKSRRKQNKK